MNLTTQMSERMSENFPLSSHFSKNAPINTGGIKYEKNKYKINTITE